MSSLCVVSGLLIVSNFATLCRELLYQELMKISGEFYFKALEIFYLGVIFMI